MNVPDAERWAELAGHYDSHDTADEITGVAGKLT